MNKRRKVDDSKWEQELRKVIRCPFDNCVNFETCVLDIIDEYSGYGYFKHHFQHWSFKCGVKPFDYLVFQDIVCHENLNTLQQVVEKVRNIRNFNNILQKGIIICAKMNCLSRLKFLWSLQTVSSFNAICQNESKKKDEAWIYENYFHDAIQEAIYWDNWSIIRFLVLTFEEQTGTNSYQMLLFDIF